MSFSILSEGLPLVVAAAFVAATAADISAARAEPADRLWKDLQSQASECGTAGNRSLPEGAFCLAGNGLAFLFEEGVRQAQDYGRAAFGPHFGMAGNAAPAGGPDSAGLAGDLDVVVPLAGGGPAPAGRPPGSALFLQQGVTRWQDDSSSFRADMRYGLAWRFRASDRPGSDIVGLSLLQLQDAERRHQVIVPAIDYAGRWGAGSLRSFIPTTGWRPGPPGREERALAGMEFASSFDLTTTLRADAAVYRWETEDGSGAWSGGARLEFGWRPHPWLDFTAGYDRNRRSEGAVSVFAGLRVPLGSPSKPPRWEGLGVAAGGSAPTEADLWRPVEGDGRIRTATRTAAGSVAGAKVRFLQNAVQSGGSIRLEVILSSPAAADIRVEVRLVLGSGPNPAVPGEDFADEPVELTIPAGAASGQVSVRLLPNDGQQENRSLSATVSLVS